MTKRAGTIGATLLSKLAISVNDQAARNGPVSNSATKLILTFDYDDSIAALGVNP